MAETIGSRLSLEEVVSSLVKVETPGSIRLDQALERIGYEMSSDILGDKRVIWVQAKAHSPQRNRPIVALTLEAGGIYHAPMTDHSLGIEQALKARLISILVNESEDEVQFSFEGEADPIEMRFIKLSTKYTREKWGSI